MYVYYLVSAIFSHMRLHQSMCYLWSEPQGFGCLYHAWIIYLQFVLFSEYLCRWWVSSHYQCLNGFLNHGMLCVSVKVMLLGSQQHSEQTCNSAPEKPSRIPPWGNNNNRGWAHDQSSEIAFLPLALPVLPHIHSGAALDTPPAVRGEPSLA